MKLYYTRHGQTEWNAQNRICSTTDLPLNETGLVQAHELAQKVAELGDVDVIAASPMLRARKTAEIVAQTIEKPLFFDERLREWDFGRLDGAAGKVEVMRQFRRCEFALPLGETGETQLQLAHRVYAALEDIRKTYAKKNVLVIAHGGVCRMIATYFHPMAAEKLADYRTGNCELKCASFQQ